MLVPVAIIKQMTLFLTNANQKKILEVLFRGDILATTPDKPLQRLEDQHELPILARRNLESISMQVFASHEWLFFSRIGQ